MSSKRTFKVQIMAEDSSAELILIDNSFAKIASAIGSIEQEVSPGLYKVRAKVGDKTEDKLFEVSDTNKFITVASLCFASPAPLPKTSTGHGYQLEPCSKFASRALQREASLFVFARDSQHQFGERAQAPPWRNLALTDARGRKIESLEMVGTALPENGCIGFDARLEPGMYFLSQPGSGVASVNLLPIVVSEGWCTQVFLDSQARPLIGISNPRISPAVSGISPAREIDLCGGAVALIRPGAHATFDAHALRLTEIARRNFMEGKQAVSQQDLQAMIYGKHEAPMLGLYAAHMLLAKPAINWDLVATITGNLGRWLGTDHPDVDVLAGAVSKQTGFKTKKPSFSMWPPVLMASSALAARYGLEPRGKLLARSKWVLQHQAGGSMWNCLTKAPDRLIPAAETARSMNKRKEEDGVSAGELAAPRADASALKVLIALPNPSASIGSVRAVPGARPLASAATAESAIKTLTEWATFARRTDPGRGGYSPFQKALRRRLLDLAGDADDVASPPEISRSIQSLARDFGLNNGELKRALTGLSDSTRDQPQLMQLAAWTTGVQKKT
jgi:hypothetical protein